MAEEPPPYGTDAYGNEYYTTGQVPGFLDTPVIISDTTPEGQVILTNTATSGNYAARIKTVHENFSYHAPQVMLTGSAVALIAGVKNLKAQVAHLNEEMAKHPPQLEIPLELAADVGPEGSPADQAEDAGEHAGTSFPGQAKGGASAAHVPGTPKKVSTEKGAAFFNLPVGALINAHPHTGPDGETKGQESWETKGQAVWKANEWKPRQVFSGGHEFHVPHTAKVFVPHDTDTDNDSQVNHAPKFVWMGGKPSPTELPNTSARLARLHEGQLKEMHAAAPTHAALHNKSQFKELPAKHVKKPVITSEGKLHSWVPHDWQVHHSAIAGGGLMSGKPNYARDPSGAWHYFSHSTKQWEKTGGPTQDTLNQFAKGGKIVPHENGAPPDEDHPGVPSGKAAGAETAKAEIGGVHASAEEIHAAIDALKKDQSTQVKLPLKHAGNPLAAMDYHGVTKAHLIKHPELAATKGTKNKHVGHVKMVVLHHLAEQVAKLDQDQAQSAVAEKTMTHAADQIAGLHEEPEQAAPAAPEPPPVFSVATFPAGQKDAAISAVQKMAPATGKGYVLVQAPGVWKTYGMGQVPEADKGFPYLTINSAGEITHDFTSIPTKPIEAHLPKPEPKPAPAASTAINPHKTVDVGGVNVTYAQVKQAHDHLEAIGGTAIKQPLLAMGHPLAATDYWHVVKAEQSKDPAGTKGMKAKPLFLQALKAHMEALKDDFDKQGAAVGTAKEAGPFKAGDKVTNPAQAGHAGPVSGTVTHTDNVAGAKQYVSFKGEDGNHYTAYAQDLMPSLSPAPAEKEAGAKAGITVKLKPPSLEEKAHENAAWSKLHGLITNAVYPPLWPAGLSHDDVGGVLGLALARAYKTKKDHYLAKPGDSGDYTLMQQAPHIPDLAGGFYYKISPDHSVHSFMSGTGTPAGGFPVNYQTVLDHAGTALGKHAKTGWETPESALPSPSPASKEHQALTDLVAGATPHFKSTLLADTPDESLALTRGLVSAHTMGSSFYVRQSTIPAEGGGVTWLTSQYKPTLSTGYYWITPDLQVTWHDSSAPSGIVQADSSVLYAASKHDGALAATEAPPAEKPAVKPAPDTAEWAKQKAAEAAKAKAAEAAAPAGEEPEVTPQDALSQLLANGGLKPAPDAEMPGDVTYGGEEPETGYSAAWASDQQEERAIARAAGLMAKQNAYNYETKQTEPVNKDGLYIYKEPASVGGAWKVKSALSSTYSNPEPNVKDGPYYKLMPGFVLGRYTQGADGSKVHTEIPFSHVEAASKKWYEPNAVTLFGKTYKLGHYYKPKGKAFVSIERKSNSYGKSTIHFSYTGVNGAKKTVSQAYFHTAFEGGTNEWHAEHKDFGAPKTAAKPGVLTAKYSTLLEPGQTYTLFNSSGKTTTVLAGQPDGSAIATVSSEEHNGSDLHISEMQLSKFAAEGKVLDQWGNTVVSPGMQAGEYHLFGSPAITPEQLAKAVPLLEKSASDMLDFTWVMKNTLGVPLTDKDVTQNVKGWVDNKNVSFWQKSQGLMVLDLVREMLAAPGAQTSESAEFKPSFLKGLPAGMTSAAQLFSFDKLGYAKPHDMSTGTPLGPASWSILSSPELSAKIKEVSAAFQAPGETSIVGTHVSGLTKNQKAAWLTAWQAGDMAKVFSLDAQGGKVSPLHPGAPGSTVLQVKWQPWANANIPGAAEVSAAEVVSGTWTDLGTPATAAEVNNYLVKAGIKGAEYLSVQEKRAWVKAHRQHDQQEVDRLSKLAYQRYNSNAPLLTPTPVWTEDIQPAKSYTVSLEDKLPASQWTAVATQDYAELYSALLQPLLEGTAYEGADLHSSSHYIQALAIQKHLDKLEADAAAEALKPKFSLAKPEDQVVGHTVLTDQFGSRYWFTPGTGSHHVTRLAQTWGFRPPQSALATWPATGEGGKAGRVIKVTPYEGDMADLSAQASHPAYDFGLLSQRQLSDLGREHLLAWALDDDGSGGMHNLLRAHDGSITSAEHPRAFGAKGWKGLSGSEEADSHEHLATTALFTAIRSGELSKEKTDKTYAAVFARAQQMQRMPDARMGELLKAAGVTTAHQQPLIFRKNHLAEDMTKLWSSVYHDAGWELPQVKAENLPPGLHSGFTSPDLAENIHTSKSYGIASFFAGNEFVKGHLLTWHEIDKLGSEILHGEGTLTNGAFEKIVAWAKSKATGTGDAGKTTAPEAAVLGEEKFFNDLIFTARSVSRHAVDKKFNPETMSRFEKLKAELGQRQKFAEGALEHAATDGGADQADFEKTYGSAFQNVAMAKFYAEHAAKIDHAYATGGTFKQGDFARWKPAKMPEQPGKKVTEDPVKVTITNSTRTLSMGQKQAGGQIENEHALHPDTGELVTGSGTYTYPGQGGGQAKVYRITLPTGESIEINDTGDMHTPKGQIGRIRYVADAKDGTAGLERIRAQLQNMGLDMQEATAPDMELHYWRHLAQILADRKDASEGEYKYGAVWKELAKGAGQAVPLSHSGRLGLVADLAGKGLSPEEELAVHHAAWSHVTSPAQVQQWSENGGYLPWFDHLDVRNPLQPSGKPYFMRFDVSKADILKQPMPVHRFHSPSVDALRMTRTGGLMSTEARVRSLGIWVSGMSSETDMSSYGSAGYVYTRLHLEGSSSSSAGHVHLSPMYLARTSNYAFGSDNNGAADSAKSSSFFDFGKAVHWNSGGGEGSNETMAEDALSLLDHAELVRASSAEQRAQIIGELHAKGVTEIRGLPVEKRIVTEISAADRQLARSKWADNIPDWHAPRQTTGELKVVPGTAGKAHEVPAQAAEAATKAPEIAPHAVTTVEHGLGAPKAAVSQLFYQGKGKPSHGSQQVVQAKVAVAERLAGKMTSSDAEISALAKAGGLSAPPSSWGPARQATIGQLIAVWAQTNNSPLAHAFQQTAHLLFGLPKQQAIKLQPGQQAEVDNLIAEHGTAIKDFLQSQYDLTQQDLAKAGITHLTLWRGFAWTHGSGPWGTQLFGSGKPGWADVKPGSTIEAPASKPFSSWAFDFEKGTSSFQEFTQGGSHTIVKTTVPASLVMSYPHSGIGSYWQNEFTVLDAPGHWEVTDND